VRTIELEPIEHIDARDEHAEYRVLHYRALTEIKGTEKGEKILENRPLLCPHTDRIDPSTNELTRGRAHSWLTITESIANNLFTLGNR
jgi:hypothetical protein